jgi:very-short-patch-repair endonuclease
MNLIIRNFNNSNLRILFIGNKEYFIAKDIAELLGYANTRDAILKHCKRAVSIKDLTSSINLEDLDFSKITTPNNYKSIKLIPESDVLTLIQKARTISLSEKDSILEMLNLKHKFISISAKETEFFLVLKTVLNQMNIQIETQYKVLNYRIDGYIEEFNIAIEFDENHHNLEINKEKDLLREKEIKDILKCSFVRLKENTDHYQNIGIVIDKIFKKKFSKQDRRENIKELLKTSKLSTKDLAEKFGVSKSTILRDLKSIPDIKKIKIGRNVFYKI